MLILSYNLSSESFTFSLFPLFAEKFPPTLPSAIYTIFFFVLIFMPYVRHGRRCAAQIGVRPTRNRCVTRSVNFVIKGSERANCIARARPTFFLIKKGLTPRFPFATTRAWGVAMVGCGCALIYAIARTIVHCVTRF